MRDRLLPVAGVTDLAGMTVRPAATAGERVIGLRLILRDTSGDRLDEDVAEVAALAERGEIELSGLLIAAADAEDVGLCGATLATPGPGGTCDLFPPRLTPAAPPSAAVALLNAAAAFAAGRGCETVQAFADPVRADDATALLVAGFERACELLTLRRDGCEPVPESAGFDMAESALDGETLPRFRAVNRASYAGSRDAPLARGVDPDADFAAHVEAPGFRPDLSRLAASGGRDAGLILVAVRDDVGDGAEWDMCYLGVAPVCRGRGVGRSLLAGRLSAARDAGAAAVTCAVDAANEPARRLYEAAGFRETGRRALFVRRLHPDRAADAATGTAAVG